MAYTSSRIPTRGKLYGHMRLTNLGIRYKNPLDISILLAPFNLAFSLPVYYFHWSSLLIGYGGGSACSPSRSLVAIVHAQIRSD